MTVQVNGERKGVEIKWDTGDFDGKVQVFAVGNDGDVHNSGPGGNDGLASLSYPTGFQGRSAIEIRSADDGSVIDSGVIVIGAELGDTEDGGEITPDDPHPDQTLPGDLPVE